MHFTTGWAIRHSCGAESRAALFPAAGAAKPANPLHPPGAARGAPRRTAGHRGAAAAALLPTPHTSPRPPGPGSGGGGQWPVPASAAPRPGAAAPCTAAGPGRAPQRGSAGCTWCRHKEPGRPPPPSAPRPAGRTRRRGRGGGGAEGGDEGGAGARAGAAAWADTEEPTPPPPPPLPPPPPRPRSAPRRRARPRAAPAPPSRVPLCRCRCRQRRHPRAPRPAAPRPERPGLRRRPITASRQTGLQNTPPNRQPRRTRRRQSRRGRPALLLSLIGWPPGRCADWAAQGGFCFPIGGSAGALCDKGHPLPPPALRACAAGAVRQSSGRWLLPARTIGRSRPSRRRRLIPAFFSYWVARLSLTREPTTGAPAPSGRGLCLVPPFPLASRDASQVGPGPAGKEPPPLGSRALKGHAVAQAPAGRHGGGGAARAPAHGEARPPPLRGWQLGGSPPGPGAGGASSGVRRCLRCAARPRGGEVGPRSSPVPRPAGSRTGAAVRGRVGGPATAGSGGSGAAACLPPACREQRGRWRVPCLVCMQCVKPHRPCRRVL